jgi:Ice-binding-like
MNRFGSPFKPLMWLMATLLAAFVAGCGGGGGGGAPAAPASSGAAGTVCTAGTGTACVDLATAGSFVILNPSVIADTAPSIITGNIGSSGTGSTIAASCAEVSGTITDDDGTYAGGGGTVTTCHVTNAALGTLSAGNPVFDSQTAYTAAQTRAPVTEPANSLGVAGNIGGLNIPPGVHNWTTAVTIPTSITLTGSATDVWIFQIGGNLNQTGGTTVTLAGAQAQNIFWQVGGTTTIGAGAQFEGIILSPNAITLSAGAIANGRMFTGAAVNLSTATVRRPGA